MRPDVEVFADETSRLKIVIPVAVVMKLIPALADRGEVLLERILQFVGQCPQS